MLRKFIQWSLVQAFVVCGFAQGASWNVCLEDMAGLNVPAKASFSRELGRLLGTHDIRLSWSECGLAEQQAIYVAVRPEAPAEMLDGVLGSAHRRGIRIEPRLEVYVAPVQRLTAASCWEVVGRALARVAAHEVAHFMTQSSSHVERGLLRDGFYGSELAGEDSFPFICYPPRSR